MSRLNGRKRSLLRRILNHEITPWGSLPEEESFQRFGNFLVVCIFAFFTHLSGGFGAGVLLGCTLGWHWSPGTGLDRWRTASLAGLSCGVLGGWVNWSLPGLVYIDIDDAPLRVFLYGVAPLAAIGVAAARIDRHRNALGIFAGLRWRPLGYIIFACSLALAAFLGVCLTLARQTAPVNWLTVGCVLMVAGAALSITDQLVNQRPISLMEVFVVSSLFGAFIAPALILVVNTEMNLPPLAMGVAVGAALWSYDRHRRGLPISIVQTILNGFACGYLVLIYVHLLLGAETRAISPVLGALAGGVAAVGLAEPIARRRERLLIWNPIVLSPLPLAALGAYVGWVLGRILL